MKIIKIQSLKNQKWVAEECRVAESFLDRLKGLIGSKTLSLGQGLLLRPCNDIHMWMMSIPIDVVFVRREKGESGSECLRVVSSRAALRPWKLLPVRESKASETLELPVGTLARCDIQPGDQLCIS